MPVLSEPTGVEQLLPSAGCLVAGGKSAHQVLVVVVPSLVISSSCARDCVFMTREMLRMMAQENLMCSFRPTVTLKLFPVTCLLLRFLVEFDWLRLRNWVVIDGLGEDAVLYCFA